MDSVKNSLTNFCKGFGFWILLILLNTRSGESAANEFKTILDIILAVILVSSHGAGESIVLLTAVLTVVVTFLPLSAELEILMLAVISLLGVVLLKTVPEDPLMTHSEKRETINDGLVGYTPHFWKSRNLLNPFEIYSYSPDQGINIRKGIIRRSYISVPTTTTRVMIYQSIWQRLLGFCDVSFTNIYTGQQFGEDNMKNIRIRSAMELKRMLL